MREHSRRFQEFIVAGSLFLTALLVFWLSPVKQVTDSHYSLLVTESLLTHGTFSLDHYAIPRLEPQVGVRDDYVANGRIWQIEQTRGRLYYYFPPGSSVLSLPYMAITKMLGFSIANPDGTYNPEAEVKLETALAAILMALFVSITFITARWILPLWWSVAVAVAAGFATQIWSTASRGLWSHTWTILLTSVLVLILVARECGSIDRLRPYLLSSLGAWLYFVRPNGVVVVLAVAIYLFRIDRRVFVKYSVSGGVWLAVFCIYSYTQFRQLVPSYYKPSRLRLDLFPVAFAGNLVSPSRGVLIYVPLTAFVLYLLIRYRETLPSRKLALLSSIIILGHLILVSSFANQWGDWWGGASYGPRYLSDVVPWFAVLMMLGLGAFLASYQKENHAFLLRRKVELTLGAALLTLSILINARGALAVETWRWTQPVTDTQMRSLLWDWKHPQFMAGLQRPKPPVEVAPIPMGTRIHFGSREAEKFLWYGWSDAEPGFRWTDGSEAALIFSADKMSDLRLRMRAGAFVAGKQLVNQNVRILLNDTEIRTLQLQGFSIEIEVSPVTVRPGLNTFRIELPNATSPGSLGSSQDNRLLGIRVEWIEFLETAGLNSSHSTKEIQASSSGRLNCDQQGRCRAI